MKRDFCFYNTCFEKILFEKWQSSQIISPVTGKGHEEVLLTVIPPHNNVHPCKKPHLLYLTLTVTSVAFNQGLENFTVMGSSPPVA